MFAARSRDAIFPPLLPAVTPAAGRFRSDDTAETFPPRPGHASSTDGGKMSAHGRADNIPALQFK
jgi:hypothetical protein